MWWNLNAVSRAGLRHETVNDMKVPIVIICEDDYARAIERIAELKFVSSSQTDKELVALAEAMLRWEVRQENLDDLDR